MRYLHLAAILSVALAFFGCQQRITDATLLSTKALASSTIEPGKNLTLANSVGEDTSYVIFIFPTGFPNQKTAIDQCIENGGGDYLTNAVVISDISGIPCIFMKTSIIVRGDVHSINPMTPEQVEAVQKKNRDARDREESSRGSRRAGKGAAEPTPAPMPAY